jgi:uncharacterized protein
MENKKELLKQLITEFQKRIPFTVFPRETTLPIKSNKIISVSGVRRSGKTHVLFETINRILNSGVPKENILFINFDDERLMLKTEEFDFILLSYVELFPDIDLKEVYVFFDEIQMLDKWEQYVRRLYDENINNIFISGSNSKFLATEIATSLRGRTLQYEVFPLSFSEFCSFRKLDTNYYDLQNRAKLINAFNEFLSKGSFPEVVINNYLFFERTLHEYYHVMIYKDLIERYQITNIPVLKYFVLRLISNLTKPVSINKIYNEIRSAGLKLDKNFLYKLADYLNSIYFSQTIGKYDNSIIKTELANTKKTYLIDNGLISSLSFTTNKDYGKLLENSVYLWLRTKTYFNKGIYFYSNKHECDFVIVKKDKPSLLIQVSYDISSLETRKREIAGIFEASKYLDCHNAFIITYNHEDEIKYKELTISVIPAYKFFLNYDYAKLS